MTRARREATPRLAVVSVPIGNLEDITLRALRVLRQADVIFAEDTRVTRRLLAAHGLAARRLQSLHDHNESRRIDAVLEALGSGLDAALVPDAGTPLISDPGYRIARAVLDAGFDLEIVPGPSALTAALAASGLPPLPSAFVGFAPRRAGALRRWLRDALRPGWTTVLFVPTRQLDALLSALQEVAPAARVAIGRELTKAHETWLRGRAGDLALRDEDRLGEATVVVHLPEASKEGLDARAVVARVKALLSRGLSTRDAMTAVAVLDGVPRKDVAAWVHGAPGEGPTET